MTRAFARAWARLALLAGALWAAALPAQADGVIDDFSVPQAAGTQVAGTMLFGQRSLSTFSGSVQVAGGALRYDHSGTTVVLRYAPPIGAALQPMDFSLVERFYFDFTTAATVPGVMLRLYSSGTLDYAQAYLPPLYLGGGGSTISSVGLGDVLQRQHGQFDVRQVTALSLIIDPLPNGEGPVSLDTLWLTGSITPVPEVPMQPLRALGLALLAGLRWRVRRWGRGGIQSLVVT